jgi:hypothetical protein
VIRTCKKGYLSFMKKSCLTLAVSVLLAVPAVVHAQFFYTFGEGATSYIITGYYGPDGSVTIPAIIDHLYVIGIADNAFLEETGVTNVTIPSSVTTIGANAFAQSGLTSITIPGTVNSIGASAFTNCGDLTNATIEDGVISIGASAFNDCPMLATVTIPSSVIGIEPYAFNSCRSLTNLTLASGLISIGDGAFGATGMTSISIPDSVNVIGEGAFYDCSALTNASIPNSVTSIGINAFSFTGLKAITVDVENTNYSSVDGVLFDKSQTTLIQYPCGAGGGYTTPNGVTSIGISAFAGSRGLTNVTISDGIIDIASNAFQNCDSLVSITIPDGVTSIANSMFVNCSSLGSVTIPGSVGSIGKNAFANCSYLTNVTIANGVGSIADSAFYACFFLRSITIPASVTNIGAYAFSFPGPQGYTFYFLGDAPSTDPNAFFGTSGTIYYLPGTTGWGATLAGLPTALWTLPHPVILSSAPSFGVQSNGFGFTISWATNRPVVVQASADLANPVWTSLQTNALTNGVFNFSDPQWMNYPGRFYRIISQ